MAGANLSQHFKYRITSELSVKNRTFYIIFYVEKMSDYLTRISALISVSQSVCRFISRLIY